MGHREEGGGNADSDNSLKVDACEAMGIKAVSIHGEIIPPSPPIPGSGDNGRPSRSELLSYCVEEGIDGLGRQAWGADLPPWAPGRREEAALMQRFEAFDEGSWCLREVDIFRDLSPKEMEAIAQAAPMRTYAAGELLYSPHKPVEMLFILKQGRVRIFRISGDGRALTTAIMTPGTIFGEMVVLGQQMYENFAEALEESVVCVMSRADVHRLLLSDPRIALRITEILGARLTEMERRLSENVFKSVPQRIAGTLVTLAGGGGFLGARKRSPQVALTHEQLAALVGTSRETATKVLGDFAGRGLVRLGRGRVTLTDLDRLITEAGE